MSIEGQELVCSIFEDVSPAVENIQKGSTHLMRQFNRIIVPSLEIVSRRATHRASDEVMLRLLSYDMTAFCFHIDRAAFHFQTAFSNSLYFEGLDCR